MYVSYLCLKPINARHTDTSSQWKLMSEAHHQRVVRRLASLHRILHTAYGEVALDFTLRLLTV